MINLRSKIEIKILGYYFLNPNIKKYINEFAKILNVDVSNLNKKLKELEKEGILASEQAGNQRYYFLNKKYPLLKETEKLYNAKYSLKNKIASSLKNLKGLKKAFIFGSFAKDEMQQESDIDILLIGSHSSLKAKRLILNFEKEFQREFNIIDLSEKEFEKRKKEKDDFIANILNNKIIKII